MTPTPSTTVMADKLRSAPFLLADWTVDATSDRIHHSGTEHKLESKMMAVLVYLAARAGEVVTREELERDIWQGRIVGYDALTGCVTKLRKTLGDDPRHPRYIETIAKKGYRLIAAVNPKQVPQVDLSPEVALPIGKSPRRAIPAWSMVLGTMLVIALVLGIIFKLNVEHAVPDELDRPSIAVLPFDNLSNDTAQDYFSNGITADITTALSNHSGLFVIAHPSVTSFNGQDMDINRAAGALGVRYVLQGSVRRTPSKLRVNAQLIDARSGVHLWAERYDREIQDVLEVQDEIAARIVGALEVKLTEEEKQRTAHRYTVSADAYDAFLRGQDHYVRYTREDNLQAQAAYQRALDLDPEFARAYSALALTYTAEHRFWHADSAVARARALALAEKAVALDATSPQTQWTLGHVHLHRREYAQAVDASRKAIRLNPNFADSYIVLASSITYQGDAAEAVTLIRKAMRLNPHYPAPYALALGRAYYFLDRYEDAVAALRDAIERNANLLSSYVYLTAALSGQGKTDDAAWTAAQLRLLVPGFTVSDIDEMFPIENPERLAALLEHLRRAGL